ncbi:helix-turn-helix domain-containing protein [Actinomadura sp. PM05-2]|uniref:Helix-turn-helix domain-containing protein n=1 Tax=Actinomadura parmotrematis TaxID=2864039 RepID=A0ABS7FUH3_9ACTN|nr:helix-turn-helix domain-containing protein [Actinomadura parmotrematis]
MREDAGLTQDAAARMLERAAASLSAYENGKTAVKPRDLEQILQRYGLPADSTEFKRLMALSRRKDAAPWMSRYREDEEPNDFGYAALEAEAVRRSAYEASLVPGLLQTPEYARAIYKVFQGVVPMAGGLDRGVELRMARQRRLSEDPKLEMSWLISEKALHLSLGGEAVMQHQWKHVLDVTEAPHLRLRVLPFKGGATPLMHGSFSILEFEEGMKIVAVFELHQAIFLDDEPVLCMYEAAFSQAEQIALSEIESRALIKRVVFGA